MRRRGPQRRRTEGFVTGAEDVVGIGTGELGAVEEVGTHMGPTNELVCNKLPGEVDILLAELAT